MFSADLCRMFALCCPVKQNHFLFMFLTVLTILSLAFQFHPAWVSGGQEEAGCLSSTQVVCWCNKVNQPLLSSGWSLFSAAVLVLICCPAEACGFRRAGQEYPFPQNVQDLRETGKAKEQVPFLKGVRLRTYYVVINGWPVQRKK